MRTKLYRVLEAPYRGLQKRGSFYKLHGKKYVVVDYKPIEKDPEDPKNTPAVDIIGVPANKFNRNYYHKLWKDKKYKDVIYRK